MEALTSNIDYKFVAARFMSGEPSVEMKTVFLGVGLPDELGASLLSECVLKPLEKFRVLTNKRGGIRTDGESANTGRKTGLWRLLCEKIGRNVIAVWSAYLRSDLTMESVESNVAEVGR